jgi:hypothetical protein
MVTYLFIVGKYIGRALTLFFDEKKPFVVLKAA